jgi:hypothetical protein
MIIQQETIKEFGKLIYDLSKIGFAVAVIAPLVKGDQLSFYVVIAIALGVVAGTVFINKGVQS